MRRANRSHAAPLLTLLALTSVLGACGDDAVAPEIPAALVGTWDATSFDIGGLDLVAEGYSLSITLSNDGTYDFLIAGDDPQNPVFCQDPPAASCGDSGDFTATASQIRLDPGTVDEVVLNYTISGTTLTVTGTVDGVQVDATFEKV